MEKDGWCQPLDVGKTTSKYPYQMSSTAKQGTAQIFALLSPPPFFVNVEKVEARIMKELML